MKKKLIQHIQQFFIEGEDLDVDVVRNGLKTIITISHK